MLQGQTTGTWHIVIPSTLDLYTTLCTYDVYILYSYNKVPNGFPTLAGYTSPIKTLKSDKISILAL